MDLLELKLRCERISYLFESRTPKQLVLELSHIETEKIQNLKMIAWDGFCIL